MTPLDACAAKTVDPRRVAAVRDRLLPAEEAEVLATQFRLLADPNRVRVLYALLEAGELCVCDLAATVRMSDTAVSHALRLLRVAGIVATRRAGRMVYYRLADAHVRMLLDLYREHLRHGQAEPGPGGR
ncbi:Transcriptional regulator [Carbonactinospora thermoautotrophica]|uniref:Transcriptional regulator n=1 Tax=Carbonactinospora thermoautotrophica TaxID=1469144 RepID=A0A132MZ15_9ACTN|nr:Transcriptional regulator [Carbonactinospora thermoautotrophica]